MSLAKNGEPGKDLAGMSILVVDDQDDSRRLLARILTLKGATVNTAASVEAALGVIAVNRPDLVLSDISMPEQDGYDLMRELRRRRREDESPIPVIAVSGFASREDRERSLREGFKAHLTKPVDFKLLIATVMHVAT